MAKDINKIVPAWEPQSFLIRVDQCRSMLKVHGLLSEAENENVKRRIDKLIPKATATK